MRRRRSNSRLRSSSSDDHHDHTTNDVSSSSSSIKGNSKSQRTNDKISVSNNEAADRYVKNCKQFDVRVDAGVVIALKTGWPILQPTKSFGEGEMLPLIDVLENNSTVKKVNLSEISMQDSRYRYAGNGNSNARVLNSILSRNNSIKDLNLSGTGLDDDGLKEICEGIENNSSITSLDLSRNNFSSDGSDRLRAAIAKNNSIKSLNLSRNALGFRAMNALLCSCGPKGVLIQTNGNYVFEEILNSVSHGIAFLLSIVCSNLLVSESLEGNGTDYHFWACSVYSFSLIFLFLSSCLYHSFFMLPSTSKVLQILDHVGIYMLIAGSYTPFLLIGLHNSLAARILLTGQWVAAITGSIFAACADLNNPITTVIELTFFLCMGFGLIFVWSTITTVFSGPAFNLLALGGAAYVIGIIFFILGEYKPIYHVVWHLFVVLAAAIHWFDVYFYIVNMNKDGSILV